MPTKITKLKFSMNTTASTVYISVLKFAKKRHCISQAMIEKFNIHFVDNVKKLIISFSHAETPILAH